MKKISLIFIILFLGIGCATPSIPDGPTNNASDPLLTSAILGGDYLIQAVKEDGSFVYEYNPKSDTEENSYNILRHGGTTYSMLELYRVTSDLELLGASKKALTYLEEQIEPCYETTQDALCVVESNYTKVGGNGLAILAMVEYQKATGDEQYLETAQALARRLQEVQQQDGHFEPHKQHNTTGEPESFVSEYYPGEAIFALTRLYSIDENEAWLDTAENNINYLIHVRDEGKSTNQLIHDHWLLYGLNEFYRFRQDSEHFTHAMNIATAITDQQRTDLSTLEDPAWLGSFYTPPRSTPTATRMEGLTAAYQLANDYNEPEMATKIQTAIDLGIQFTQQTQCTAETAENFKNPERTLGGFHESLTGTAIRIDYVQHNISALLGAREVLFGPF